MEKILVTGATGLIGLEVARQLSEAGHRPRVMVRRPRRGALLNLLDVEPVQADLTRPASLHRAVEGIDTVLHLAARATMEPAERLWPSIVEGTRLLAQAAAQAGARRFVFSSSLLVHGPSDTPLDASSPVDPQVGYGVAKVAAEQQLQELHSRGDLATAALRLPHVYGAGDLLFSRIRRGLLVTPGLGENVYSHLQVRDAARLLIEVARQGWVGVSPVGDDQPQSWRQFFATVNDHYAGFRHLRTPGWMALLGARALSRLDVRSRPSMITPDTVRAWNLSQPVAPRLVWDDLGVAPEHPTVQQGVPATLDACLQFRWRHPVDDSSR